MSLGAIRRILESPWVYLLWQRPFVRQKIAPVLNDLGKPGRILDVGCGPGTNTPLFGPEFDYVGVDLSPEYVKYAKRKHGRPFFVCDVTQDPLPHGPFDVVLINSLMHHLSDLEVATLLDKVKGVLAPKGQIQIVDLVLPPQLSLARWLAQHDRGDYARPGHRWRTLFDDHLQVEHFSEFTVGLFGLPLWVLCHVRGEA